MPKLKDVNVFWERLSSEFYTRSTRGNIFVIITLTHPVIQTMKLYDFNWGLEVFEFLDKVKILRYVSDNSHSESLIRRNKSFEIACCQNRVSHKAVGGCRGFKFDKYLTSADLFNLYDVHGGSPENELINGKVVRRGARGL